MVAIYSLSATSRESVDQKRAEIARTQFAEYIDAKRELDINEQFLVSFSRNISQDQVARILDNSGALMIAVHICDNAKGISAFFLEADTSATKQLATLRRMIEVNMGGLGGAGIPSADPQAKGKMIKPPYIVPDFKMCGVELRANTDQMKELSTNAKAQIRAIEVTNRRMRKLPIYVGE